MLLVNFDKFTKIFNKSSNNTIRNWHNKLLELGFIKPTINKNIFRLTAYERYITPGRWEGKASDYAKQEKDQSIEIILQNFGINPQIFEKNIQSFAKKNKENEANNASISIGSYKDEYKYKSNTVSSIRSEEEYQKIKFLAESYFTYLTDPRGRDKNYHEVVTVDITHVKRVVETDSYYIIFFHDEYRSSDYHRFDEYDEKEKKRLKRRMIHKEWIKEMTTNMPIEKEGIK